ncbi:Spc98 family-domain-containing protein [Catenaria anguillulae PL171]|uniref:Spindle pole body component n=1 Tax=Catenaria anguillulae PL171 TaxID=765915 RepID=A0A1Y2HQ20_9FUNG|nr:Spc98 family-domain-containing protein [Catenaria anguillulae PL171]
MNETEQYHLQRLVEKFIKSDPVRRHAALRQCTSLIRRTAALASNEHQVWTKLEAVETKLRIDGQDVAADFLRQRVEYLVPPPSPELLETERLHYAILDLLLHMMPSLNPTVMARVIAQSQLAQELARRNEQSKAPPISAAEVYQGLEPYAPPTYAPSSPGSPRSVSSSSSSNIGDQDDQDLSNMEVDSADPMRQHSFGGHVPPPADPLPWLAHLAALQYWRRAPTSLPPTTFSAHDPHTLAFANAHHTSINSPADPVPFPATVVTEADLVRECILALRRMPTWLFSLTEDGKLRVARRVALTHLAIDTLSTVLAHIARVASKLLPVHEFAKHLDNRHASDPVLAAFVLGVQMELDALDSELSKLEVGLQHALLWQKQSAGPRKASLISLSRQIPQLTEFVLALGDFLDASSNPATESGTMLLDRLVDQLSACQLSPLFPNWLRLFLTTFSALCAHLDRWLNEGQVLAPDSFFIRTVPAPSPDSNSGDANEFDVWRHGFLVDTSKTPRLFPADLIDRMLVIGKSVALSRTRPSALSSSSAQMLSLAKDIDSASFSQPPTHTTTTYFASFTAHLHSLVMDSTTCPLSDLVTQSRRLTSADIRLARPMGPILIECAATALAPYLSHSAHVVSRFMSTYRIDAHLRLVSSVYLMENGAEWTQALAPIFRRIKRRREWATHDIVFETIGAAVGRMRQACGLRVGQDGGHGDIQIGIVQGRNALGAVYASYSPAWPVNLIVSAGHVDMYNRILTALLYLKQAKYLLEDEAYVAIRRLRSSHWDNVLGLRFQLVHFVNAVEAFWMVSVIDGERHVLRRRMEQSQTVDSLISAHDVFVNRVVDLMLLRTTPLSDAIGQVFGLCSEFAAVFDHLVWSQFVDRGTTQATVEWKPKLLAKFKDIAERFMAIRRFLVTSLDIMATKGNAVHLESLLYALSTESDGGLLWQ